MSFSALLLAAGASTRMGGLKALLPWQGATLLEFQIEQLLETGAEEVVVVLGHAASAISPRVPDVPSVRLVVNEDYAAGRAGSVRLGMANLGTETEAVLVLAVDQPRPSSLLLRLVSEHLGRQALITVPSYQGRRGHPAVFDRRLFAELAVVTEEGQGLRAVMQRYRQEVHDVELDDPVVLLDLNTPSDYESGQSAFAAAPHQQR